MQLIRIILMNLPREHNLPDWLPLFAAEHAARPYLQKAAAELKDPLEQKVTLDGCPVCGEPPRLL